VDTGNTRWVDANKCEEKEQKEQEYRDYKCSAGSCNYSINDTKWVDTGNTSIKANGTICGCTANNTVKRCYDGNCTDTGIGNTSNCCADVACDGKKPWESCGDGRICDSTCNCVSLVPLEITSFAPLSYVDDTVGKWRAFNVTINQAANVSWYLNGTLVLTNESIREAKCMLLADVVGEHNVTVIASNANGSDMQTWILNVTERLNCTCGDICVIPTGWWRDGGAFHPTDTPIQSAIDNAISGETICVKDGTYTENVDVDTQLTIRSENGAASTTVHALTGDPVFDVTADYVTISGFTVNGTEKYL
jgi:hypothetical protein